MVEYAAKFHWADYLLFALSLAVSIGCGIFFAVRDKWHKQSAESYLMANRKMNWFLVGMSFLATTISALLFIGGAAEVYYYGIDMLYIIASYYIGATFTSIIVVPKFYMIGFKVTSAYEMLALGVSLYVPSLVLSHVSDLGIYWCIALGGIVCLIYTAFGGMKAVIWVDTIQLLIVALGMTLLAGKGTVDAGGITEVWERYSKLGERNNWQDLSPEPWNRHTVWSLTFLYGMYGAAAFGTNQAVLQRYMTVPKMRKSQLSILIGITVGVPYVAMVAIIAIAAFTTVGGDEPLLTGKIDSPDQILPYFLMYLLGDLHGIPGLVVAALFAASLSTLSSGQTALIAVILEDIIRPIHRIRTGKDVEDKMTGVLSRVLGVVVGVLVLLLSLVIPLLDNSLVVIAMSIGSFIGGPLLGLLLTAFFCFWVEKWGAFVGFISSVAWAMMLYFGSQEYGHKLGQDFRPLFLNNFTQRVDLPVPTDEPEFFDISYTWYTLLDVCVVAIVATPISIIVHCCTKGKFSKADIMPPRHLLYTTKDFLIALGCKKEPKKEIQMSNGKDYSLGDGVDNTDYIHGTLTSYNHDSLENGKAVESVRL